MTVLHAVLDETVGVGIEVHDVKGMVTGAGICRGLMSCSRGWEWERGSKRKLQNSCGRHGRMLRQNCGGISWSRLGRNQAQSPHVLQPTFCGEQIFLYTIHRTRHQKEKNTGTVFSTAQMKGFPAQDARAQSPVRASEAAVQTVLLHSARLQCNPGPRIASSSRTCSQTESQWRPITAERNGEE